MLRVRSARRSDIDAFVELAGAAGTGFTSLALGRDKLAAKLEQSEAAFASSPENPGSELYQMMLEDMETGKVVGCSAVKAAVGVEKPYFDYKILTIAQSSAEADRRHDMDVMVLVNDFAGCSEVGTLFVHESARGAGVGRLVAQTRYLLIAADYDRFGPRVLAELRGVVRDDGSSPFFDHVSRPFFQMTFAEADNLSAKSDNQFILDLMPKHPIYVDLLPEAARRVIGLTHPDGAGARRLLEWEGFTYDRYIDIFDGGPLMSVKTREARTGRESVKGIIAAGTPQNPCNSIATTNSFADFRSVRAMAEMRDGNIYLDEAARAALDVVAGDEIRIWMSDK